jgi:hypothetical protein
MGDPILAGQDRLVAAAAAERACGILDLDFGDIRAGGV